MTAKRFYIAVLMGIILGIIACLIAGGVNPNPLAKKVLANIFVSRVLIGFVIGISAWKMGWFLHGVLMGLIVGLPFSLSAMAIQVPGMGKWGIFFLTWALGVVYGFIIELVTSVFFKAEQPSAKQIANLIHFPKCSRRTLFLRKKITKKAERCLLRLQKKFGLTKSRP